MKLIVGLGNPGKKYLKSRHNLGFRVADELAKKWSISYHLAKKFSALICRENQKRVFLVKPTTFMNRAGLAVARLVAYYHFQTDEIWVIHDDLDLALGKIKVKKGGGTAGHRGLESIVNQLGTNDFTRFRLGIGHPGLGATDQVVKNYVLSPFDPKKEVEVEKMIKNCVKMVEKALGRKAK